MTVMRVIIATKASTFEDVSWIDMKNMKSKSEKIARMDCIAMNVARLCMENEE